MNPNPSVHIIMKDKDNQSFFQNNNEKNINEYTSPWAGLELTIQVMIGIDCIGSC
jgi:hypothetical protein